MAKKKFSYSYALVFLLATLSLSGFFNADTFFEQGRDLQGTLVSLSNFALFIGCIVYMAFRIYCEEKSAANLRSEFGPFEWLLSLQAQRSNSQSKGALSL